MKVISALLLSGSALLAQTPTLEPVLKAELAFAKLAEEKGIRTAFLASLTEDARVFTPRMISAKAQYGPEPGDSGHLVWYPEAMGIAASGDLAWSLGPWTYAMKKGGPVLVNGHFLSMWQKQADGAWKVEADIGVPHGAPETPARRFEAGKGASAPGRALPPDATVALRQKEAALSAAWRLKGGTVLVPELAREARLLRPRAFPLGETAAIQRALEADRPGSTWEVPRVHVAPSGDLGWTCGETGPDDQGRTASFLRVWILEGADWKVLFDVRLPHPPSPK